MMKFIRSFFVGFCSAAAVFTLAAAVGLILYRVYL